METDINVGEWIKNEREARKLRQGREEMKGEAKKNVIEFNIEKISREFSKKDYTR